MPAVGAEPDVSVLVLPGAILRYARVCAWIARWPAGERLPEMLICGAHPRTRTEATGLIEDVCERSGRERGAVRVFPYLAQPHVLPPGDRKGGPAVDAVIREVLGAVLPERARRGRGLFGHGRG